MPIESFDSLEQTLSKEMQELRDLNWELEFENMEVQYIEQIDQLIDEKTTLGGVLEEQRREFENQRAAVTVAVQKDRTEEIKNLNETIADLKSQVHLMSEELESKTQKIKKFQVSDQNNIQKIVELSTICSEKD